MKFLVVTPTLGEAAWLEETIASVRAQPFDLEHVLVAPGYKVKELQARVPQVTVVAEHAGGMYAAINAGLEVKMNWDAFTYINDDDLLLPNFRFVAQRVALFKRDTKVVAYGGVRLIDANGRRIGGIPISRFPTANRALYGQRIEPVYQHGTLVTRGAWEALGGFDDSFRFCGDSEFLARACVKGIPFVRVSGAPVAAFRLRAGQLTKNRSAMMAERGRVDQKLGLLARRLTLRHHWARLVFRMANLPVYAERAARFGFASFDEVLKRAG
jgi:glycosyltransferase involved in cell wall biosynthesis